MFVSNFLPIVWLVGADSLEEVPFEATVMLADDNDEEDDDGGDDDGIATGLVSRGVIFVASE